MTDYTPRSRKTLACNGVARVSCVKVLPDGSAWVRPPLRQRVPSSSSRVWKLCTARPSEVVRWAFLRWADGDASAEEITSSGDGWLTNLSTKELGEYIRLSGEAVAEG